MSENRKQNIEVVNEEVSLDNRHEMADEKEVIGLLNGKSGQDINPVIAWVYGNKPKVIAIALVVLVLLIASVMGMSSRVKDVDLAALEWTYDDAKIQELKSTLIDGVSIESLYKDVYVYNWSYAHDDGNEYLKVETEENVDIYNVTDGELEESVDLLEMKKNFVGKQGLYIGDLAEVYIEIDTDYNITAYLSLIEGDEVEQEESVEELPQEDMQDEQSPEGIATIDLDLELHSETDLDLELDSEMDLELEKEDILDGTNTILLGVIVSVTEVEFTLETGEMVKAEWDERSEVMEVNLIEEFLVENVERTPEIYQALTDKLYVYTTVESEMEEDGSLSDLEEERIENPEEYNYNGDYSVDVLSKKINEIKFNLSIELEESLELLIDSGVAYRQGESETYLFENDSVNIYFEQINDRMLITGYDAQKNMIIRLEK